MIVLFIFVNFVVVASLKSTWTSWNPFSDLLKSMNIPSSPIPTQKVPILIIGSGISGLSCAKELLNSTRLNVLVLEKSSKPGGRIQTDKLDGFLLDRGFQIFIDSYPLVQNDRILDKASLELCSFNPGALIYFNKKFHVVSDPLRRPTELFETLLSPIGSLLDKIKVGILSVSTRFEPFESIETEPELTTKDYLESLMGISDSMINRFFKPFYQGIFLSPLEEQSSRMFRFVFKVLAEGSGCLPRRGICAVPESLAASLPSETIKYNTEVTSITAGLSDEDKYIISAKDGITGVQSKYSTNKLVVATDAPSALSLLRGLEKTLTNLTVKSLLNLNNLSSVTNRSSTCLYYGMEGAPPIKEPVLILNAASDMSLSASKIAPVVNNVCFPSQISPAYAPAGSSLASVTLVESNDGLTDGDLDEAVRSQLTEWWGSTELQRWKLLRVYRIKYAQPSQRVPYSYGRTNCALSEGLYMCGDHVGTATLNGAIESGIRVADTIAKSLI